jgi:polar amino acid transport system permease protein
MQPVEEHPAQDAGDAHRRAPGGEIRPVRHPGRWVAAAVLLLLAAMVIHGLVSNPRFQWDVVGHYLLTAPILAGVAHTMELTVAAMAVGVLLGAILAIMRLSSNAVMKAVSHGYVWFFRGTPVLVQLIFWYNLGALYPRLSLGLPFGTVFVSGQTNTLITPWLAAVLGLGLNEAAYMSEIVRAGILSIDQGQTQAARSLGLSSGQTMRQIVLPQAVRFIIPPTGNETIGMLKWTSIVSVLALSELLYSVQAIYSVTYQTIPLLIVACVWYLVLTTILSIGQYYIEKHFSRGAGTRPAKGVLGHVRTAVAAWRW